MGGGSWTKKSFEDYSLSKGRSYDHVTSAIRGTYSAQEMFTSRSVDPMLNPYKVTRECCDSEEHPETVPVILGLDETGSMGPAGVEVAKKIGTICETLYAKIPHVQIMIMGIGDLSYDHGPIQVGQFESDIRIAEQLDKIWFEMNGGGNAFESYSAAWLFGANHCKLDCWNRGKRGLIITTGDEPLNPYLPKEPLNRVLGSTYQADVETKDLFKVASAKYNIYHIAIKDSRSYSYYYDSIHNSFGSILEPQHLVDSNIADLSTSIVEIVQNHVNQENGDKSPDKTPFIKPMDTTPGKSGASAVFGSGEITW